MKVRVINTSFSTDSLLCWVKESCIDILAIRLVDSLEHLHIVGGGAHQDRVSLLEKYVGALDLLLMHIRVDLLDHLPGNVHLLTSHALGCQVLVCEVCKDVTAMLCQPDQVPLIEPSEDLHFVEGDASSWILV